MILYVDGSFVEHGETGIDPLARGCLLGEGVFETVRVERRHLCWFEDHYARLGAGARALDIPFSLPMEELHAIAEQVVDSNECDDGRLRITLLAGESGSDPFAHAERSVLVVSVAGRRPGLAEELRERGLAVGLGTLRVNQTSPLARIKSVNYADRILARREAIAAGLDDLLLRNIDGTIVTATAANLFIVDAEGTVATPPVPSGALPGIMRKRLLRLGAELGFTMRERTIDMDELTAAREAFLTNVLIEVMPVVRIAGWMVGREGQHPVARQLMDAHRAEVERTVEAARHG
jgi:branched-subunit amino acid aminotransferase/4-amino-4-deoxychorismate lyase